MKDVAVGVEISKRESRLRELLDPSEDGALVELELGRADFAASRLGLTVGLEEDLGVRTQHDDGSIILFNLDGRLGARANPIAFLDEQVVHDFDPFPVEVASDLDAATELRDLGRDHSRFEHILGNLDGNSLFQEIMLGDLTPLVGATQILLVDLERSRVLGSS